jgi:serine/threonine protein kinase/serine phosphatase RsbU (regulator of sigma subunit)
MSTSPGQAIGKYRLILRLGEGAMGEVWMAEDQGSVHRKVALKLIPAGSTTASGLTGILVDEARAMVGLPLHPNLVALFDVLEQPDLVALVMELIEGPTLRAEIERAASGLSWAEIYPIARGLMEGLIHAHAHGLVHRDLKPENIKLQPANHAGGSGSERVKILDFGLARLDPGHRSTLGEVGGTFPYMSPEQFRGELQGPAADQYAFAVILWELLCGAPPYGYVPPDFRAFYEAHCHQPVPRLRPLRADVPAGLESALRRALAKNPADRHSDMTALRQAILPSLAHLAQWGGASSWESASTDVGVPSLIDLDASSPVDVPLEGNQEAPRARPPSDGNALPTAMLRSVLVQSPAVLGSGRESEMELVERLTGRLLGDGSVAELMGGLLEGLGRHLHASGGVLLAKDAADGLTALATWGSSVGAEIPFSRNILKAVLEDRQAMVLQAGGLDPKIASAASVLIRGIRTALVAPMLQDGAVLGLLYLDGNEGTPPFGAMDLQLARTLANLGAVRLQRARMEASLEARRRMERELALARQVQAHLQPSRLPGPDGWEVHGSMESHLELSGDGFSGWSGPGQRYRYALGDVAGKGLGPALLMAAFLTWMEAHAEMELPLPTLAARISEGLARRTDARHYLTAVLLDLAPDTGVLQICNAGHVTPLLIRADGKVEAIPPHGRPLGLLPGGTYESEVITMKSGEMVCLVTDGVTEAGDPEGEPFGLDRLAELVQANRDLPLPALDRLVRAEAARYAGGFPHTDDETVLLVRRR